MCAVILTFNALIVPQSSYKHLWLLMWLSNKSELMTCYPSVSQTLQTQIAGAFIVCILILCEVNVHHVVYQWMRISCGSTKICLLAPSYRLPKSGFNPQTQRAP